MDTETLTNLGADMIETIIGLQQADIISQEEARELLGFGENNRDIIQYQGKTYVWDGKTKKISKL